MTKRDVTIPTEAQAKRDRQAREWAERVQRELESGKLTAPVRKFLERSSTRYAYTGKTPAVASKNADTERGARFQLRDLYPQLTAPLVALAQHESDRIAHHPRRNYILLQALRSMVFGDGYDPEAPPERLARQLLGWVQIHRTLDAGPNDRPGAGAGHQFLPGGGQAKLAVLQCRTCEATWTCNVESRDQPISLSPCAVVGPVVYSPEYDPEAPAGPVVGTMECWVCREGL